MVRTKSRGAILLGNISAYHENMCRTNSRRVQKTQKRRKGLRLSRPFRPLPLIRGSGLPNVTCKVQAPLQDAPFYILHFTFYTLPARWWAFSAPTAILSLYLSSFLSFPIEIVHAISCSFPPVDLSCKADSILRASLILFPVSLVARARSSSDMSSNWPCRHSV